ncbi:WD repeat-containing protein 36 [Vespula squamosa]|uniref:WD repeat-containing protein 36 n=1 Tax=Vespula squamosa TaxID=30214 RepID=A0ABD2A1U3_VESSQ
MVQRKIFVRNRALGYVTHFNFLSVFEIHPNNISCLSTDTYRIYTAAENIVYAWKRGTELKHTYKGYEHSIHII